MPFKLNDYLAAGKRVPDPVKKKIITLGFENGLTFQEFTRDVLWIVSDIFDFQVSDHPKFIIFGPYGYQFPRGDYTRIGYFCENIIPDPASCEWAFGMRPKEAVRFAKYCQIRWHGITPKQLFAIPTFSADENPLQRKFANFIYSQSHRHREKLFEALNEYRVVDAPGLSMNNMPSFDDRNAAEDKWTRKRAFIRKYKFTIAIENYHSRGYYTEKLTDPLIAGSVPIYWGDHTAIRFINKGCFIDVHDYIPSYFERMSLLWDYLVLGRFSKKKSFSDRAAKRLS